jgi:lipid-A-disaccharide synthase
LSAQRLRRRSPVEAAAPYGLIVGLATCGSRKMAKVRHNIESLIRGAQLVHQQQRPDVRFLVAASKPSQADTIRDRLMGSKLPHRSTSGAYTRIIELSHSLMAVSGSVSLEILARSKPAVMVYRHHWFTIALGRMLKRAKYITLVNLLADRVMFPEYFGSQCLGPRMAEHVLHWLNDEKAYRKLCGELATLREK